METMSALDAAFLQIEDRNAALHIGSVGIFEGPVPAFDAVRAEIARKLDRVPRYRQRMLRVPGNLGRPVWREDPTFDIELHLRRSALPRPGGDRELADHVGWIMSEPLDHDHPLWEDWVVEGLEHGRWALVSKVHHSVVDGIAGTDLLTRLFGADPAPGTDTPATDAPGRLPSARALVARAVREDAAALTGAVLGAVRHPRKLAGQARTSTGVLRYLAALRPVGRSSILGPIGASRGYRWAEVPLADALAIRAAYGCTVNDVVVAAETRALRELLVVRGEEPTAHLVRTLVPVSVRRPDQHGAMDNRVSAILLDLPVDEPDPVRCLEAVAERMRRLKHTHEAEAGELMTALGDGLPPPALMAGLRLVFRVPQQFLTTVTTDVPGPREQLHLAGRPMVATYPYVPIADRLRTGFAVTSYGESLYFGITADEGSTPDIDVLRDGLLNAFAELVIAAGVAGGVR